MEKGLAITWRGSKPRGELSVRNGTLGQILSSKHSEVQGSLFSFTTEGNCRLEFTVPDAVVTSGAHASLVTVREESNPFSFFVRDVNRACPIIIPAYGVAVTEQDDPRSYDDIAAWNAQRGLVSNLHRMALEQEESYENAAKHTRNLPGQTWLGLGRDMRIFGAGFRSVGADNSIERLWDWVQPRFHGYEVPLPENNNTPVRYTYMVGRGLGCEQQLSRRLEDGVLPILHGQLIDDDITYEYIAFVSLEASPPEKLRGTHFLVADKYSHGQMFTAEQATTCENLLAEELSQPEETVFYLQVNAVNTASTPRYAWLKSVFPQGVAYSFEREHGYGSYSAERIFAITKLDGVPLPQEEIAVLLQPGESVRFDTYVPHQPIGRERARRLAAQDFVARHAEIRTYWMEKLANAAQVRLPEKRIDEMVRAGLLHLDLVTYGLEPDATVAATIGVYSPIGSESSPIIQFMDSMGWHDLARRSLNYFLDKQHDDGFMQNFGGYMLETGAALWSIGEHYRYTRDDSWLDSISPRLLQSANFLLRWSERNQREELRGKGYGLLEGKTADPEDPFRSFMLNGYAFLGLSRVAEILAKSKPQEAQRLAYEAMKLKDAIRTAFFEGVATSPVVPLADGTWCPTAPPWVEGTGPLALLDDGLKWYTHGTVVARDSLLGPLWLVAQEVIAPTEPQTDFLLNFHNELMCTRNVAFSQPYYSPHPWIHLMRGEVNPFLKAYYNGFSSLADRETYSFWEHYFYASPHKTHEEGWFLMQTRWMLYMERGQTLKLLGGVPRSWLEHGKVIELNNVATYFGSLTFKLVSELDQGCVHATVECSPHSPASIELRVPHPNNRRATRVQGGRYDSATETVTIDSFTGQAHIVIEFV